MHQLCRTSDFSLHDFAMHRGEESASVEADVAQVGHDGRDSHELRGEFEINDTSG